MVAGIMDDVATDLWVFGYGSILWNPGFSYVSRCVGYVDGFARRFWQGSTTHRGTPDAPGRVATLVQLNGSKAWGMAYHVVGQKMVEDCLEHLGVRECHLGGYEVRSVEFVQDGPSDDNECKQAWAFIAVPGNRLYLGPATVDDLAVQVVKCRGVSGRNCEYVTQLAEFIRSYIPGDNDDELFALDAKIKTLLEAESLKLALECDGAVSPVQRDAGSPVLVSPTAKKQPESVVDFVRRRDESNAAMCSAPRAVRAF